MSFTKFRDTMINQLDEALSKVNMLYVTDTDKDDIWEIYLSAFPAGTNLLFRKRTEHDCSCCKQFIRAFGNVVYIIDGELFSIWDIIIDDAIYSPVVKALSEYVKSKPIVDVFVTDQQKYGTKSNIEIADSGSIEWTHFYYKLDSRFITILMGDTIDTIKGRLRDSRNVFARSLKEITNDAVETVLELISQGSLYRGEEWKEVLVKFLNYKKAYNKLDSEQKELYAWTEFNNAGIAISKIRNHSIGVLLTDISDGMDLDAAVNRYEQIVAPSNYKRPKPIYTKRMIEEAQKKIIELGFSDSLRRRYANIDDITVNNILFVNRDISSKLEGADDIFAQLKSTLPEVPKNLNKIEEVSIEKFIQDILPTTTNIDVLFENRLKNNLVSLIAPEVKDSKSMFKWSNNFSWAYNGNVTDSMREQVKAAGGDISGVMRFSIRWNDLGQLNDNDFDAHCITPSNFEIYYAMDRDYKTRGSLDVDIRQPRKDQVAIENITFPNIASLLEGEYIFNVHNYANRSGTDGFAAEIEVDGEIYQFEYRKPVKNGDTIPIAKVNYSRKNGFIVTSILDSTMSQMEVWNCKTNTFVPINIMMMSPNYWDDQIGIGNKHYFFMMNDCINEESPNGFYNEFLNNELQPHRKVLEALGSQLRVKDNTDQLSGIGFSSTLSNTLVCRVTGHTSRIIKIKF